MSLPSQVPQRGGGIGQFSPELQPKGGGVPPQAAPSPLRKRKMTCDCEKVKNEKNEKNATPCFDPGFGLSGVDLPPPGSI